MIQSSNSNGFVFIEEIQLKQTIIIILRYKYSLFFLKLNIYNALEFTQYFDRINWVLATVDFSTLLFSIYLPTHIHYYCQLE